MLNINKNIVLLIGVMLLLTGCNVPDSNLLKATIWASCIVIFVVILAGVCMFGLAIYFRNKQKIQDGAD